MTQSWGSWLWLCHLWPAHSPSLCLVLPQQEAGEDGVLLPWKTASQRVCLVSGWDRSHCSFPSEVKQILHLVAAKKKKETEQSTGQIMKNWVERLEGYGDSPRTFLFPMIKRLMLFDREEWARTARDKANIRHILKKKKEQKVWGSVGASREAASCCLIPSHPGTRGSVCIS